jgi:hypothetical protein
MKRRKPKRLALQANQLALAVPQVVAHRMARIALAGPSPNARDRREFNGMVNEKIVAFWQSWFAMGWAVVEAAQQAWIASLLGRRAAPLDMHLVFSRGLAPVHGRAMANARRLARTPLR